MAKGEYLSNYQQKVVRGYYENRDTIFVSKLSSIVSDLAITKSEKEVGRLWAKAKEFLAKTTANPARVQKLVAEKNLEELARIVNELANSKGDVSKGPPQTPAPTAPAAAVTPTADAGGPTSDIPPEMLKSALTAFKKRLKLTILNDESRLAPRAMTGGKKSEITAIIPPDQFPKEVWDELVKQNKLRYTGQGFYELLPGV
ncbi:MAG TPA: hypothetical protein VD997_05715 [Phycisphaerales bacterium]|nr:hypothetical protein [Phycisphaerales bacterium]